MVYCCPTLCIGGLSANFLFIFWAQWCWRTLEALRICESLRCLAHFFCILSIHTLCVPPPSVTPGLVHTHTHTQTLQFVFLSLQVTSSGWAQKFMSLSVNMQRLQWAEGVKRAADNAWCVSDVCSHVQDKDWVGGGGGVGDSQSLWTGA